MLATTQARQRLRRLSRETLLLHESILRMKAKQESEGGLTPGGGGLTPGGSRLARAFSRERAAGLRRTAGDALSDLGDPRACPCAVAALTDRSKLVRWRAARVLGELAAPDDGSGAVAALRQAERAEPAFEVAFEMAQAARRVEARGPGGASPGAGSGPMWKQIQDSIST